MSKVVNEYSKAFGRLYAKTPKAVFAAVAYSFVNRFTDDSDDKAVAIKAFLKEWRILHQNGIVTQAPPYVSDIPTSKLLTRENQ